VSRRSQATSLFGRTYAAPFGLAPMGMSALAAYRGDLVLARAAAAANLPMIMSGSSLIPLEDVAREGRTAWFQAYLPGEPERILALVDRVERAGFDTLLLTVDVAVSANRENNVRAGFSTPLRPNLRLAFDGLIRPRWLLGTAARTLLRHGMPHFENSYATRGVPILARNVLRDFGARDHLDWSHLELIRRRWKGSLVVKGIMHKDDARRARETGADGIIVSNHGGRQVDGAIAALDALTAIVDAVGGELAILFDSGIRSGVDVVKALALGADAVLLGRPYLWGLALEGRSGVETVLRMLLAELDLTMVLTGHMSVAELDRSALALAPS
jgi:L-lactate dehydrogenase (cytochrome)